MPSTNKVSPSYDASADEGASSPVTKKSDDPFIERQYLIDYTNKQGCYDPSAAEQAEFISRQPKSAFELNLWTLLEKRSCEWKDKPDDGQPAQGEEIGDLFDNKYEYHTPDTVLTETKRSDGPLENTRKRVTCPKCDGKWQIHEL